MRRRERRVSAKRDKQVHRDRRIDRKSKTVVPSFILYR